MKKEQIVGVFVNAFHDFEVKFVYKERLLMCVCVFYMWDKG